MAPVRNLQCVLFIIMKKAILYPENGYMYLSAKYHPQANPGSITSTSTTRRICRMLLSIVLKHFSNIEINLIRKVISLKK
jgi:hypothetical protein